MTDREIPKEGYFHKNVGYGLVSYERTKDEEPEIRNGRLFTKTFYYDGFEWDESRKMWKYDVGLGLVTYIVPADDPEALEYVKKYGE